MMFNDGQYESKTVSAAGSADYTHISSECAQKFTQQPTLDDVVQYAERVRSLEISLNNTYRSSVSTVRQTVVQDIQIRKIKKELVEAYNDKAAALFLHTMTQQEFAAWQYNNNVVASAQQQPIRKPTVAPPPYRAEPKYGPAPVKSTSGVSVASEPVEQSKLFSDEELLKSLKDLD